MNARNVVKSHGEGCTVTIEVTARASKSELVGVNAWRGALQVRVAAEPREGAANEELVRFLSERLGVDKGEVVIVRGERSSKKVVYLPVPAHTAASILGVS